jgi:class 3 adenylate cyclase
MTRKLSQDQFLQLVVDTSLNDDDIPSYLDGFVKLSMDAKSTISDALRDSALIQCAADGDLMGVQKLVRCGISVNAADYDRRTVLHIASACGHLEIVQFLVASGADIASRDRWGRCAIADAIEEGHAAVVQALSSAASPEALLSMNIYCPGEVTVLLMDIKNFTASCATLSAFQVGSWITTFYSLVDQSAGPRGVRKAEVRGDCCICVAGGLADAPARRLRSDASAEDQVARMLDFASALHASFLLASPGLFTVRMGIAFGEAAFVLDGDLLSIQGDVVNMAARMEAHAVPGTAVVHASATERWAKEGSSRPPPHCTLVDCKGKAQQRAAAYECAKGRFCETGMPIHFDI